MWTHSGWEDCDAVCGGGKTKEECTNTHTHIKNVYASIIGMYIRNTYM